MRSCVNVLISKIMSMPIKVSGRIYARYPKCQTLASGDLLLQIYLNLFFIILHDLHIIYVHFLKKCQNVQTKNKLKELILAK